MAKNTNYIIGGLLAAAGIYFIAKYFKDKKAAEVVAPEPVLPTRPQPTTAPSRVGFPLKRGSKGSKVTELQQIIKKLDATLLPKFGVDGDFGSETEAAVEKLLGKKTIDSQADINKLNNMLNQKLFPIIFPKNQPSGQIQFGIPKPF